MAIPPKRPCEIYIFPMTMSTFCVLFQCNCHSSYALIMCFQTFFNNRQFLKCTFCYTEIISPPRMFLPLDILSEYRIQNGTIGPLYVIFSYSTWLFCRGVSGFATDCPCGVWCCGLTTCLLYVCPRFGNRLLNNSWVASLI